MHRFCMKNAGWITLALLCMTTAAAASGSGSASGSRSASASAWTQLIRLPVADPAVVPASTWREALARAARASSPVDIALAVAGVFEGERQWIEQVNASVESPSATRVTVVRDGLLDDAVRSERWDIDLARTAAGTWEVQQATRAWRCRRGGQTARFATQKCP